MYIFTALYCTVGSALGFQAYLGVLHMCMELFLPNQMLIAVIH